MESNSTLQLEQLSLGDATASSSPFSLTSLPPDSSQAPTLSSLPPELFSQIFEATQTSVSSKATLASLCLVNRYFVEIARPILYHEIHLQPNGYRCSCIPTTNTTYVTATRTLCSANSLADLVKTIKLTLDPTKEDVNWKLLKNVMGRCKRLERVTTGWEGCQTSEATAKLFEAIGAGAASIKHLEVPVPIARLPPISKLLVTTTQLETLVFKPVDVDHKVKLKFRLREVVWMSRLPQRALGIYLSASTLTLIKISCHIAYENPPSLDIFPNLSTLRLVLGPFNLPESKRSNDLSEQQCSDAIKLILRSTHSLPLRSLAVITRHAETAETLRHYAILDSLPPALSELTTNPHLLCDNNIRLLFSTNNTSRYPSLRSLKIVPSFLTTSLEDSEHEWMKASLQAVAKAFGSKELSIAIRLGAKLGERFLDEEACSL